MDDKGWHPGRESGIQFFSKLLPQEKTLLDSAVTIGTQKNITNNCCKTEREPPGASLSLCSLESHCKLPPQPWDGSMRLQAKSTISTLQSLNKEWKGHIQELHNTFGAVSSSRPHPPKKEGTGRRKGK